MKKLLLIGLVILNLVVTAKADTIVDTGNITGDNPLGLGPSQWLAAEFSISEDYTITDLQGYGDRTGGGSVTAAIYRDGGALPGSELYSNQFTVGGTAGWYGVDSQNWFLSAGTYWAAFEVRSGDTYNSAFHRADAPLDNEAYWNGSNWNGSNLSLAIRIYGTPGAVPEPVPEPATMLLFGLGLLGLARVSRKKHA